MSIFSTPVSPIDPSQGESTMSGPLPLLVGDTPFVLGVGGTGLVGESFLFSELGDIVSVFWNSEGPCPIFG